MLVKNVLSGYRCLSTLSTCLKRRMEGSSIQFVYYSAMQFGDKGRELLLELERSDWLPPYNEDAVRRCVQEAQGHWQEIESTIAAAEAMGGSRDNTDDIPDEYKISMTVHLQSLLRNKRCLLTYMQHRLERISTLRWEAGPAIPPALQVKLSPQEVEFFAAYDRILSSYAKEYPLLDLTALPQPPKEVSIEVRVKEDCGEVETEQGPVMLEKGTKHFLRRADVEDLIRQGRLEHIPNHDDV